MLGEVRIYQTLLAIANCRTYIQLRFRTHIPLASLIRYRIGPLNSQPALSYRNSGRPQDLKHIPPGRETTYPREKQNPIAKLALPRGPNVKIRPLGVAAGKTARKSPVPRKLRTWDVKTHAETAHERAGSCPFPRRAQTMQQNATLPSARGRGRDHYYYTHVNRGSRATNRRSQRQNEAPGQPA